MIILAAALFSAPRQSKDPSENSPLIPRNNVPANNNPGSNTLKTFSPDEFRELYNSFVYPNTEQINEQRPITGNAKADNVIRRLAEARGYKLRSAPVTDSMVNVNGSKQLQQRAAQDWKKLQASAEKDGIQLEIEEALRSSDDQKTIFLSRLGNISYESIAAGSADDKVNEVLKKTAPPGYSRHHSGYTIDLVCGTSPGTTFENSICFEWLKKDNYKNAKQSGWIPSYPQGTELQGPEPESWEYVWVGIDALRQ